MQSIVSPSNGSLDPNHGTLTITTKNRGGTALAGVALSGTGPGTFSGTTDASGCANFTDLPFGTYTVTPSGANLVDTDGNPPKAETATVVAGGTSPLVLQYDREAKIPVKFKYRVGSGTEFKSSPADSVFVYNLLMTTKGKAYWTPGRVRQLEVLAAPVYPYMSEVTVYAGVCEKNNPGTGLGQANVTLQPGQTLAPLELQVPALEITVKNGTAAVSGAQITITDEECKDTEAKSVVREYTSDSNGHQSTVGNLTPEYGLPYGKYEICASAFYSGKYHRLREKSVVVHSLTSTTSKTLTLSSASAETGSSLKCP